jgi:hypothetical protein
LSPAPPALRVSEHEPVAADVAEAEALSLFRAKMDESATPLVPTTRPPRLTSLALDDTARGEATGLSPAGPVLVATLKEGQRATTTLSLGPKECATFVAQGGLGIIEVDLFLTEGERAERRVLAEDSNTGPIAVIGGRGKCVPGLRDRPLTVDLFVTARRGAGVVLVGRYIK